VTDQGKIEVRVARSIPEVEALRVPWVRWLGHRDSDIDFYLMILQAYPEIVRPHVIALYRDGKPDAILVGRLDKRQLTFDVGYFHGVRPWARCLTFVYDALHGNASPENTQILLQEVMTCLKDEADVAVLEFVPLRSPLYNQALSLPNFLSRDTLPPTQEHDIFVVPDSVDDVYRHMSSVRRRTVRAVNRKIESRAAGEPKIVCYQHESELDRLFHDVEEIARKTYQRGLGAGFADRPDVRMRLAFGARKGWLRAHVLYLDGRPAAFWIIMLYGETAVGEYTGYDREFGKFSPGMFLLMHIIEGYCNRAHGEIVKEMDFGYGHADYKAALCGKSWLEARVYLFSPTLKGFALKSLRTATRILDGAGRKLLASANLFPRLKRVWRNRLAHA
jgi:Acetyltransferase (GNAT) domain